MQKQSTEHQALYKIVLSENVERKIREWCAECPNNEWSGTLFYNTTGSLETKDLVINVVDFYVSDIGTGTYTVYDFNEEVVAYMVENELIGCYCGLIHSHQQMSAFFSGTDTSTLNKEGASMPHFVSLIVNNAGQYVAKITRQTVKEFTGVIKGYYLSFNGEQKSIDDKPTTFSESTVENFDLTVIKPEVTLPINETHRRAEEIRAKKKKEEEENKSWFFKPDTTSKYSGLPYKEPNLFDDFEDFKYKPLTETKKESETTVVDEGLYDFPDSELCLYASKILRGNEFANYMSEKELKKLIGNSKSSPMVKEIRKKFPKDTEEEYRTKVDDVIDYVTDIAYTKRDGNVSYGFYSSLTTNLYNFIDSLLPENTAPNKFLDAAMEELLVYQSMAQYYE